MREIMFRGKSIESGEWLYGSLLQLNCECNNARIFPVNAKNVHESISINSKTIGQFTGLIDKNGKKIFENDVVRFEKYCCVEEVTNIATGIVEFSDAEFCVEQISGIDRGWMNLFYGPDGKEFSWNELEIIGNVFDNPELVAKND